MGIFSHILLRAKRPCTENTTIIKQTMSVSFNKIKTARNVGAREEKHSGELSLSLLRFSETHFPQSGVCLSLSRQKTHTEGTSTERECTVLCVYNLCSRRFEAVQSFCQAGRVLLKLSNGCDSHI